MLIGIIGLPGSGKSTVSDILEKKYNFISDSFAKPVKDIAAIIFNWDRDMLEGITPESRAWREEIDENWSKILGKNISPRIALQLIGTEFGRKLLSEDIWIESLKVRNSNNNVVISDVRYKNEADAIKKNGGILIKVIREEPSYIKDILLNNITSMDELEKFMKDKYPEVHSSDYNISLLKPDYIIDNSKDFLFLETEISKILKFLQ